MPHEIGAPVSASAARRNSLRAHVELAAQVVAVAALAPVAQRVGAVPGEARRADRGGPGVARYAALGTPATTEVDQSITDVGLTTCLLSPSSFGSSPSARPTSCGRCSTGMPERPPDDLLGQRLLQVEVEVAQRARRHEAVGVRVDRVAEVAAGLLERRLLVHRDDREAAALVLARVVDDGAAERLDQLLQVRVARVLAVDPEPVGRAHDVAAVERPDRAGRSAAA